MAQVTAFPEEACVTIRLVGLSGGSDRRPAEVFVAIPVLIEHDDGSEIVMQNFSYPNSPMAETADPLLSELGAVLQKCVNDHPEYFAPIRRKMLEGVW